MPASDLNWERYISLLQRNKKIFFATALAIMTAAVFVSYALPKEYEARSTVFVQKNVISELVKGIAVSPSMNDTLSVMDYALTSRSILRKAIDSVDFNLRAQTNADMENLINEIRKNIDVKRDGKTQDVFVVSFKYSNPRIARDFVNTLVQLFIAENISAQREEASGASQFLSQQIATYKDRLDKAQAAINRFKDKEGAAADVDTDRLLHDIDQAQEQLAQLEIRKKQLEAEEVYQKNASDPLQVKLTALKQRLADLRTQFTENFPEIVDIKSQLKSLQQQIKSGNEAAAPAGEGVEPEDLWKIETDLKAVRENEAVLKRYIARENALLDSVPNTKSTLEKLQAAKTNEENMYNLLFLRQNQSEISSQLQLQDKSTTFRVVDPAVMPLSPVSPNRKKIILLGIVLGLAAAFGLLLALDYIDSSVKTLDSLKTFGLSVLAVIPHIKGEDEIAQQKRSDLRVYVLSGIYFSLILAVLMMDVLGVTFMDDMMSRLQLPHIVVRFLQRL